jgi:hypothetical protein
MTPVRDKRAKRHTIKFWGPGPLLTMLLAGFLAPPSFAQRPGRPVTAGHPSGGVRPVARPIAPQPFHGIQPRPAGVITTHPGFRGIHPARLIAPPIFVLRQPTVLGARYFWSEEAHNFTWSPGCGHLLGSGPDGIGSWDYSCTRAFYYQPAFENYVLRPNYEVSAYLYGLENRELVWLYAKDGTVYSVTDYWFTDGQVHFLLPGGGPGYTQPLGGGVEEQVIGTEGLDIQRTIDVNTARGFRVVMRNEPLESYVRNHPNETPLPLTAPKP